MMELNQLQIGEQYTYIPPQNTTDNLHFTAIVDGISKAKRVIARVFMEGHQGGVVRYVSAKRLVIQGELIK